MKTLINFLFIVALWIWASVVAMGQCQFIIVASENAVCEGDSVTLTVIPNATTTCNADYEFSWSDGIMFTDSVITIAPIPPQSEYSVTVNGPGNIIPAVPIVISVTPLEDISIDINPDGPFCSDDDIAFLSATPSEGVFTGDGVQNGNQFNPVTANIGSNTIQYTVTYGQCEDKVGTTSVIVNERDEITNFESPGTLCVNGDNETFDAMPPGGIYEGNGMFGSTFFPDEAGVGMHLITYTYDPNGLCPGTKTIEINVISSPMPEIETCQQDYCTLDEACTLEVSQSGGTFSITPFVQGAIISNQFIPGAIVNEGSYTITYSIGNGTCTGSASIDVNVFLSPDAMDVSIDDPGNLCENGGFITLGGNPSGGTFESDEISIGSDGGLDLDDVDPGTYIVSYTYENENDCERQVQRVIVINAAPTVEIEEPDPICVGGSLSLSTSSDNYSQWEWTGPNNFSSTAQNPTVPNAVSGTYTVTVTGANGCKNTAQRNITIYNQPTVTITGPTTACSEDTITLVASVNPLYPLVTIEYNWERDENGNDVWEEESNDSQILVPVSSDIAYRVSIKLRDSDGNEIGSCARDTSERAISVELSPSPTISFLGDTVACSGGTTLFYNSTRRSGSFHDWRIAGSPAIDTILGDNYMIVQWPEAPAGFYDIEVLERIGSISSDCKDSTKIEVTLSGTAAPPLADILFSPLNNTLFYNDSTDINCYQWGYLNPTTGEAVEIQGEIYQSYVVGDTYDENIVYWCRAKFDCNDDCSTTAILARIAQNDSTPPEEEPLEQFVLYPNPNDGSFRLEANRLLENSPYEIRVTNVLGQVVRQETVTTAGDELDVQIDINDSAGVYYMSLYRKGKLKKVIPFVVLQP